MKNSIYIILLFSFFLFACQKSNPEIATTDELSSISYSEKIFTQAVQIDNQVITVINDGSSSFLTSYDADGNKVWSNNIDAYIIPGNSFQDIAHVETILSPNGEIVLNMLDDTQTHKTVKFSSSGNFINEFSDVIYQTDSLFIGLDTIDLNGMSEFLANGIFPLSNGDNLAISSWTPNYPNRLVDTTIIQLSFYNNNGQFIEDRYIIINDKIVINRVFISSDDNLIFIAESSFAFITDLQGNLVGFNQLPVFEIYSFFENSKGDYIFSGGTFNNNTDYIGILFSVDKQAQVLWSKTYMNNSAWIFTSMNETTDGYLFTGFNINKVLLGMDWRTTFDIESVKAVLLKTDFRGVEQVRTVFQGMMESNVGAVALNNENITLLGGKYDRTIYSTFVLKFDQQLNIIK